MKQSSPDNGLPQHVALIADGNRRWAKQRGLAPAAGHRQAVRQTLKSLVKHYLKLGIPYFTIWAFSTENWQRSAKEVRALMNIFRQLMKHDIDRLNQEGVKLNVIGDMSRFDLDLQQEMATAIDKTKENRQLTLTLAINYGGRDELTRTIKKIASRVKDGELEVEQIDQSLISQSLDTAGLPDPDLIIRTSGEQRLSGFLTWQGAYSEYYFPATLMPDFGPAELDKAVAEFRHRKRNFGK